MKKLVICSVLSTCFLSTVSAQTTILSEDFESGIPGSWTIVINDTNTVDTTVFEFADGWIALQEPFDTSNMVAGATSYFRDPAAANRWLISPAFTVSAYGNFLNWRARSHDVSFLDSYSVFVSTSGTGLASFTDTIAIVPFESPEWVDHEINLSAEGYNNQTIHVAFVLRSYDAFKLYLDDIAVRIEDPLTVGELTNEANIELYPNPASENLTIKGESIESVRILSMSGQLVHEQKVTDGEKININALQAGSYIVEVQTAKGTGRAKLLKR